MPIRTALVAVGQSLVAVRDWTFLLGPGLMASLNALLLGTLMYRSGLVPRIIPSRSSSEPLCSSPPSPRSSSEPGAHLGVWHGIATAPIFVWELSLGVWLVVKGFKPSPITATTIPARAGTPPAVAESGRSHAQRSSPVRPTVNRWATGLCKRVV